jgi:hypothetical protein
VCLQPIIKEDIAMEYTQQDARSTTQEIAKNTSDLILFIIVEDPGTIDLQIWNTSNRMECVDDDGSKIH